MGVALIIFLIILLCWPTIVKWIGPIVSRWVNRFMANRAEDFIRNATGMPPRPGSRKARKQARQQSKSQNAADGRFSSGRSRRRQKRYDNGPLIPKEYAEDVEFTETVDYSETTIAEENGDRRYSSYSESQVSDVEWEEIKTKKK